MPGHAERMDRLEALRAAMANLASAAPMAASGTTRPVFDEATLVAIRDGLKRISKGTK